VQERLVACGQHIAPVRSVYRWGGTIHDDSEMRVALHTRASLVQQVIDRTRQAHPYDVPCVLAFAVDSGNGDYVKWVMEETSEPGGDHLA
jgi:periplasmic divalent cation tolerance protein